MLGHDFVAEGGGVEPLSVKIPWCSRPVTDQPVAPSFFFRRQNREVGSEIFSPDSLISLPNSGNDRTRTY